MPGYGEQPEGRFIALNCEFGGAFIVAIEAS